MSLTKRYTGDFKVESVDSGQTLIMDNTGKVTVSGDFTVLGDTTIINSTITEIVDNTIVLNSGEDGPGVSLFYSGLEIDRGYDNGDPQTGNALDPAGIRFSEPDGEWQINLGTGILAIDWVTISTGGSGITAVVQDTDPHLGGDLIVAGFSITSAPASNLDVTLDADGTGLVKINHTLSLENQSTPAAYNTIYADAVGDGGTGLYTGAAEELVSKNKAILYGLIF